jgi:hypothetical protein
MGVSKQHLSRASELHYGPHPVRSKTGRMGIGPLASLILVNYGAPATAAANDHALSQSVTLNVPALLNGAKAGTNVTPRNIVAAWTGTAVLTVTGTDEYGRTMREASASGTSFTGKKAFKTITSAVFNASVTLATIGVGDVLGLPFRADANSVQVVRANNAADAATLVVADTATATATTGDVRGTVDPAVALNGTNTVTVLMAILDNTTELGAYGQPQF